MNQFFYFGVTFTVHHLHGLFLHIRRNDTLISFVVVILLHNYHPDKTICRNGAGVWEVCQNASHTLVFYSS